MHCRLQCFGTVGWTSGRASEPVKIERSGAGVVICLKRGADFLHGPADATAIPKRHHLLTHLNSDWFRLFGTGLPGCQRKEDVKRV